MWRTRAHTNESRTKGKKSIWRVGPEVGSIKQRVQSCDEGSSIIRIAIEFTANGWLNVFVFQMNARDGGKWRASGVHMEAAAVVGRKIIPNHDYVSQENEEKAQDPFQRSPMTLCRVKFRSVISNVQS